MEERRRLTLEEIDERHPDLLGALRDHPHVGWLLVRSTERGPLVLGWRRRRPAAPAWRQGRRGPRPAGARSRPTAAAHLLRTDGFEHVADIMVGSFYDPELDEGCCLRGADLLPRRPRRAADPPVHPPSRARCEVPDEPIARRRRGACGPALGLACAGLHGAAGSGYRSPGVRRGRAQATSARGGSRARAPGDAEPSVIDPGELSGIFSVPDWLRNVGLMAWLLVGSRSSWSGWSGCSASPR